MPMDKNFVNSFYLNTGVMPNSYSISIMSENKVVEYLNRLSVTKLPDWMAYLHAF